MKRIWPLRLVQSVRLEHWLRQAGASYKAAPSVVINGAV